MYLGRAAVLSLCPLPMKWAGIAEKQPHLVREVRQNDARSLLSCNTASVLAPSGVCRRLQQALTIVSNRRASVSQPISPSSTTCWPLPVRYQAFRGQA